MKIWNMVVSFSKAAEVSISTDRRTAPPDRGAFAVDRKQHGFGRAAGNWAHG
jgi:hypothetical protein